MHSKPKMYLRLTALKLQYDVDECYDLVFPLDLFSFSAWRWKFHFRNMITMPHCDNVPITHQWNVGLDIKVAGFITKVMVSFKVSDFALKILWFLRSDLTSLISVTHYMGNKQILPMHLLVKFCLCVHDVRYCFCFVCFFVCLFVQTACIFLSLLPGLLLADTHPRGSAPLKILNCS